MKRFLKICGKILLGLVGILSVLLVIFAGTAYWAFRHPQESWVFVEKHLLPEDLKITWDRLDFAAESLGGLNFRFDVGFQGLRITKAKPLLDLAFPGPADQRVRFPPTGWRMGPPA